MRRDRQTDRQTKPQTRRLTIRVATARVNSSCVSVLQALNCLAVFKDNKQKVVDAGALQHYVKLLSPERDQTLQSEASRGLWLLAFKCKDSIVKEQGCLDGYCVSIVLLDSSKQPS